MGVHGVGKTTTILRLKDLLKKDGFDCRVYGLDNYRVYDNTDIYRSQVDRFTCGSRKMTEAFEDKPEIALFDRSLICNLLYSKWYNENQIISNESLHSLKKIFNTLQSNNNIFNGYFFFLNPSIDQIMTNIHERNGSVEEDVEETRDGKISPLLITKKYVARLQQIYEEFFETFSLLRPVYALQEYSAESILELLKQHDIVQYLEPWNG